MIDVFSCACEETGVSFTHQEEEWEHIDGKNSVIAVPELFICNYCNETFTDIGERENGDRGIW